MIQKSLNIVTLLLLVNFLSNLYCEDKHLKRIEGLFYLDAAPIVIEIDDGIISRILRPDKLSDNSAAQIFIAPGFIDNQVNGYLGVDFSVPGLTVEDVRRATQALWKVGVTTYLPTLVTSPPERLSENLAVLAQAAHEPDIALSVPGFHLEGPFISPEDGYRGAHNKAWVRPPNWEEFLKLNQAAKNKIIQVTLAPELDGAMEFIQNCTAQGIVVGLGHHHASAEQIKRATDLGAAISVHLGNGCANFIHRHDNPLWPQLAEDRLWASIIVDGFHLRAEEVKTFFRAKGVERLILTSDMTKLAGLPPGEYVWNEMTVVMTPEGMIQYPAQNVLAGASLPIGRGIFNMMKFSQCSLAEAIQMATTNPARLYQLNDRGEIKVGKRADLVLFSIGESDLIIHETILAGREVNHLLR
ncbi:MAG: N-acetylglucosamine-6-phosphate deacetylase [candidate division KSB1 bacterium]|nr:N-acetylglucosamine-6-phosphate deacetylase [candidate division KSB1 bacterium]